MENLTLKQKQKIEDSLKQKEEFYKLLQKQRYIKEKPIVAYVTKKTYNNGLEKISIKNDVKKEKQPDSWFQPFTTCVTWNNPLNFSEPQCCYL